MDKTVTIDAGHGGTDPGAIGSKSNEKTHALAIAQLVNEKLHAAGVNTVMTRNSDVFVELTTRSVVSNNAQADAFLSIHMNSAASKSATGTEILYMNAKDLPLANAIHPLLVKATGLTDRGVKYQNVSVVRKTAAPAVLAEIAFVSNLNDEAKLLDAAYRDKVAQALTDGILKFLNVQKQTTYELQRSDGSKMADLRVYGGSAYVEARKFATWFNLSIDFDMGIQKVRLDGKPLTTRIDTGVGYIPIREAASVAKLNLTVDNEARIIRLSRK